MTVTTIEGDEIDVTLEPVQIDVEVADDTQIDLTVEPVEIDVTVEETVHDVTVEDTPIEVVISEVGDRGPKGDPGQDGTTTVVYIGGVPTHYEHDQVAASAVWHIVHNLGYYPAVTVIDNAGTVTQGSVEHLDVNTLEVSFYTVNSSGVTVPLAFAGKASMT